MEDSAKPKIVYEDNVLLVIDKPAGMIVNRAETTRKQVTVQDWAEAYLKRSGIVHRLDKETSGLVVIAKTPEAFADIQEQFKKRQVIKKYLTLVHGQLIPAKGIISAPVSRSPFNRKKFGVFLGGREAETRYKTINNLTINNQQFTLLEVTPKTGRTHQIRIHLKYLGHPVVGDALYGGRKNARKDRQWCKRQFLHACFLKLTHPATRKPAEFHSEIPADLKQVLSNLTN